MRGSVCNFICMVHHDPMTDFRKDIARLQVGVADTLDVRKQLDELMAPVQVDYGDSAVTYLLGSLMSELKGSTTIEWGLIKKWWCELKEWESIRHTIYNKQRGFQGGFALLPPPVINC